MRPLLIVLLAVLAAPAAHGQIELPNLTTDRQRELFGSVPVENLTRALAEREARILRVSGRGQTAGVVLDAYLVNVTSEYRHFDVYLDEPLYLRNKNPEGRSMIVTRLYTDMGFFLVEEGRKVVPVLKSPLLAPVDLWAYSIDFDKDNPALTDEFELRQIPADLQEIAELIAAFERFSAHVDNAAVMGDDSVMRIAQIALWKAQEVPEVAILKHYPHKYEHMKAARILLGEDED